MEVGRGSQTTPMSALTHRGITVMPIEMSRYSICLTMRTVWPCCKSTSDRDKYYQHADSFLNEQYSQHLLQLVSHCQPYLLGRGKYPRDWQDMRRPLSNSVSKWIQTCILFSPWKYVRSTQRLFQNWQNTMAGGIPCHGEKETRIFRGHDSCYVLQVRSHFVVRL